MIKNKLQQIFFIVLMLSSVNIKVVNVHYTQQTKPQALKDITNGFTDMELEAALSDLSLKDLNTLQTFIDSADYQDFNYDENNLMDKNSEKFIHTYDNQNIFHDMDYETEDEINNQPLNTFNNMECSREQRGVLNNHDENPRTKRQDNMMKINEDYIKQLDYSFPQNLKQNDIESELKKDHIRVKRH